MRNMQWTNVQASDGNSNGGLPAGAYVLQITNVADNEAAERIEVVWDVAEGEHKGHYGDAWGAENPWAHSFIVSYKKTAEGLFKHFLDCIEASNPSFTTAQWQGQCNPQAFVGKLVGASWGTELSDNPDNPDKPRRKKTFPRWFTADQIRKGDYTVPPDVDKRTAKQAEAAKPAQPVYSDVPF